MKNKESGQWPSVGQGRLVKDKNIRRLSPLPIDSTGVHIVITKLYHNTICIFISEYI